MTIERIRDILEGEDCKVDISESSACIEFWTDTAGQDIATEFDYDGTAEDFIEKFEKRAEGYDVDEEVELFVNMRGQNGVPNTVREILDDCQEAKDTLMNLASLIKGKVYKYRVWATVTSYCYVDVEAETPEDAIMIAEKLDGGEFTNTDEGDWRINQVSLLEEEVA